VNLTTILPRLRALVTVSGICAHTIYLRVLYSYISTSICLPVLFAPCNLHFWNTSEIILVVSTASLGQCFPAF